MEPLAPAATAPAVSTQKSFMLQRDAALCARFTKLYKKKRVRIDDVILQLEKEFFITARTIRGILKKGPPPPAQATAPA